MSEVVTSNDTFVWDCRDCGFIGDWLTTDGCCPQCLSRNVATKVSDRAE